MVRKYKWPTDPPGKAPSHSISYAQHQKNTGVNYGNNNAQAFSQYATSQGLDPATWQPKPSPPPFDAELEARRTRGIQRRTDLTSDLEVDVTQTANEYGFKWNPATGQAGGFDPSNPFSQAALLMKARKERDQGENTGYASAGQLYSGAYQTAKKETQHGYDKGYDTLRRGFDDYVKNYLRRKRDINHTPIEELANL